MSEQRRNPHEQRLYDESLVLWQTRMDDLSEDQQKLVDLVNAQKYGALRLSRHLKPEDGISVAKARRIGRELHGLKLVNYSQGSIRTIGQKGFAQDRAYFQWRRDCEKSEKMLSDLVNAAGLNPNDPLDVQTFIEKVSA